MKSERIKASELVYKSLHKSIKQGKFKPGDKLPTENEIANSYEVSRNSVRTALNRLSTLGMIESFQGRGTFVKKEAISAHINHSMPQLFRDSNDYVTITNLRIAMEVHAAGLAAVSATKEQVDELEKILENIEANKDDLEYYNQADMEFHLKITEVCGNSAIDALNRMIRTFINDIQLDLMIDFGNTEGLVMHRKIFDAIKTSNVYDARKYMYDHLHLCIERYNIIKEPANNE